MQTSHLNFRSIVLAAWISTLGLLVACGKMEPKRLDGGPRITSLYAAAPGTNTQAVVGNGSEMQLTFDVGSQQKITFKIKATQATTSFSGPQTVGNIEYALQSICVDAFCERIAFLLLMTSYSTDTTATTAPLQGGYGGTNRYVTGRESKAYLFRKVNAIQMEQAAVASGAYTNVSQALTDLGAYN